MRVIYSLGLQGLNDSLSSKEMIEVYEAVLILVPKLDFHLA